MWRGFARVLDASGLLSRSMSLQSMHYVIVSKTGLGNFASYRARKNAGKMLLRIGKFPTAGWSKKPPTK
jgi:hypothetical protein